MSAKTSTPSIALKRTLVFFLLWAIALAALSIAFSGYFTEDIVVRAAAISRDNLASLWSSYRKTYIDRGRVRRPKNGNDTVSEGQAYAMIRAVWLNDRETFDQVYQWTEENLSRFRAYGDHLLSWRFGADQLGDAKVMDPNPALDADLDYALALFLAARRWPDNRSPLHTMPYRDKAAAVAENIMAKGVHTHPNGELVLLPWPMDEGRGIERDVLVNPSYFSPGHYRIFEQETGNPRWGRLISDTYRQINRILGAQGAYQDQVSTVPDWIIMNANGDYSVDPSRGFVSGWDAFRIWWRIRLDFEVSGSNQARELIDARLSRFLVKSMEDSGGEVATESKRDGTPIVKRANAGMVAVYGWAMRDFSPTLSRTLQRQAIRRLIHDGDDVYFQDKDDYYTNSWAWYALAEGDMLFPFGAHARVATPATAPTTAPTTNPAVIPAAGNPAGGKP